MLLTTVQQSVLVLMRIIIGYSQLCLERSKYVCIYVLLTYWYESGQYDGQFWVHTRLVSQPILDYSLQSGEIGVFPINYNNRSSSINADRFQLKSFNLYSPAPATRMHQTSTGNSVAKHGSVSGHVKFTTNFKMEYKSISSSSVCGLWCFHYITCQKNSYIIHKVLYYCNP